MNHALTGPTNATVTISISQNYVLLQVFPHEYRRALAEMAAAGEVERTQLTNEYDEDSVNTAALLSPTVSVHYL